MSLKLVSDKNIFHLYAPERQDFMISAFHQGHRFAITTPRFDILASAIGITMLLCLTAANPPQIFLRALSHDVWEVVQRDEYDLYASIEIGEDLGLGDIAP